MSTYSHNKNCRYEATTQQADCQAFCRRTHYYSQRIQAACQFSFMCLMHLKPSSASSNPFRGSCFIISLRVSCAVTFYNKPCLPLYVCENNAMNKLGVLKSTARKFFHCTTLSLKFGDKENQAKIRVIFGYCQAHESIEF